MTSTHAAESAIALVDGRTADEIADRLREGLARYNEPHIGERCTLPLVLALKDESGELIGGLAGKTYWNALHIELLWVSEVRRGRGYGRQLIAAAEAEGRRRGVEVAYVTTVSFQAPEFYERLGYSKLAELENTPKGFSRLWFSRRIASDAV